MNFWTVVEYYVLLLWVREPEALVSAVLALAAATLGAYFLHQQIRLSESQDEDRRKRSFRATRAVLPLTLSSICDYASAAAREWKRLIAHFTLLERAEDGPIAELRLTPPDIPHDIVSTLREAIRDADEAESQLLIPILDDLQVRHARLRDAAAAANDDASRPVVAYVYGEIVEISRLYARASRLFDFARGEGPLPSTRDPVRAEVANALHAMRFYLQVEDQLDETFNRYYPDIAEAV
jgi:hypothetical protein